MGRESRLHPNEMLIIWPSSFSGNAVALRLLGNPFHADHGFHPWLSNATASQLRLQAFLRKRESRPVSNQQ